MKSFLHTILILFLFSGIFAQENLNKLPVESNSFTITHSGSHEIFPNWTISCNNGSFHYENSYYLVYDLLNDFNLNGDWIVQNVSVAIEDASSSNQSQDLIVKLYVMSDYDHHQIIRDSLTLLASDTVQISSSDAGTLKDIDFLPGYTVKKEKILVLEFLLPDGSDGNNLLFLGSNDDRISDSTYIRAPFCNYSEPVNISEIMFPEVMIIADVSGVYASPEPVIQSFTIQGQLVETEIKNDPDYTVKIVMPADTNLTALTPEISIPAGFQVTPASGEVVDFSGGPVTYTVDNNFAKVSQSWDVYVVNAGPDIIGASLPSLNGDVIINGSPDFTVEIPVIEGTDLTDLSPEIFVYNDFILNPESETTHDFSSGPVTYTVSHQSLPLTQDWQVSVIETPADVYKINSVNIFISPNPADKFIKIKTKQFVKAKIFDFSGKIVKTSFSDFIDTENLPEGIYFIKIYTLETSVVKKMIVKHY